MSFAKTIPSCSTSSSPLTVKESILSSQAFSDQKASTVSLRAQTVSKRSCNRTAERLLGNSTSHQKAQSLFSENYACMVWGSTTPSLRIAPLIAFEYPALQFWTVCVSFHLWMEASLQRLQIWVLQNDHTCHADQHMPGQGQAPGNGGNGVGLGRGHLPRMETHTEPPSAFDNQNPRTSGQVARSHRRHDITWQLSIDHRHTFSANTTDQRKAVWGGGILWPQSQLWKPVPHSPMITIDARVGTSWAVDISNEKRSCFSLEIILTDDKIEMSDPY